VPLRVISRGGVFHRQQRQCFPDLLTLIVSHRLWVQLV